MVYFILNFGYHSVFGFCTIDIRSNLYVYLNIDGRGLISTALEDCGIKAPFPPVCPPYSLDMGIEQKIIGDKPIIKKTDNEDDIPLAQRLLALKNLKKVSPTNGLSSTSLLKIDKERLDNALYRKSEYLDSIKKKRCLGDNDNILDSNKDQESSKLQTQTLNIKSSEQPPQRSSVPANLNPSESIKRAKVDKIVKTGKSDTIRKVKDQSENKIKPPKQSNKRDSVDAGETLLLNTNSVKKNSKPFQVKTEPLYAANFLSNPDTDHIKKESVTKRETTDQGSAEDQDAEYRWWEESNIEANDGTIKWSTLEHNGLYFPPPYDPHGVRMLYDGKPLDLVPECEEVVSFFAALIGTDHAENPIFRENFFDDFRAILIEKQPSLAKVVVNLERCDFNPITEYLSNLREQKKNRTKEEKEKEKADKLALEEKYGICYLDGRKEKVGNFRVEPPGLFRGRGKHPKAGKLKTRVFPEQITINIGESAKVPEPPSGHKWANVIHDPTVTWLATWTENINKATKYVFLAAGSSLKGQSDLRKFETARTLAKHVEKIRAVNATELHSKEMAIRQRATALWLIDRLALRAGNEKGDDEADTVGCCSLRREHIRLEPPNTVVFDFLGKDSIRYLNEVQVDPIIFKNMAIFMRPPKTVNDPIFDRLTTGELNKYLTGLMPGLTAKVFRTFNASFTFQQELEKNTKALLGNAYKPIESFVDCKNSFKENGTGIRIKEDTDFSNGRESIKTGKSSTAVTDEIVKIGNGKGKSRPESKVTGEDTKINVNEFMLAYNRANRQVAVLCNHQRAVPKTHDKSMERLEEKILSIRYERHLVRKALHDAFTNKEIRATEGFEPEMLEKDEPHLDKATIKRLESALKAKAEEEAAAKSNQNSEPRKEFKNGDLENRRHETLGKKNCSQSEVKNGEGKKVTSQSPSKKPLKSLTSLVKRFKLVSQRLVGAELQRTERDENKATALGTSKTNYIDPRITAAWCKRVNVSVEKFLNKSLREKFKWAMSVEPSWSF